MSSVKRSFIEGMQHKGSDTSYIQEESTSRKTTPGMILSHGRNHRCKKRFYVFIIFIKNTFFIFWNAFYFLVATFFYLTKPAKLLHKTTILSDVLNVVMHI